MPKYKGFDFKSIICLNGNLPDEEFISQFYGEVKIFAADGAFEKLMGLGVVPDYVVGDLDSSTIKCSEKVNIIHLPDQSSCDFEKCIEEVKGHNLGPSLILGIAGGEIDHIINNLNCFVQNSDSLNMVFVDISEEGHIKIGFVLDSKVKILGKKGNKISLFSYANSVVNSSGLTWDLQDSILENDKNFARNIFKKDEVKIVVQSGKILVVVDSPQEIIREVL